MADPNFIPDSEVTDVYDPAEHPIQAGLEGALRGVTGGLSDVAMTHPAFMDKIGASIAGVTISPEAQKLKEDYGKKQAQELQARQEANPVASTVGNIAGSGVGLVMTGGVNLGESALARIGGSALEGGILGGTGAVTDYAYGDPNLDWQKVASYVGMGALLGGGLTGGIEGVKLGLPYLGRGVSAVSKAAKNMFGAGEAAAVEEAPTLTGPLGEMQARQKAASYQGINTAPGEAKELQDALSRYDMKTPMNEFQKEAFNSKSGYDAYQTAKIKGPYGDLLQGDEALQKQDLLSDTSKEIRNLAGEGNEITGNAVEGGNTASDYLTNAYQQERQASGELVGQAKSINTVGVDHLNGVVDAMTDANPELLKMIKVGKKGIEVKPYSTSMGITEQTHRAVKSAINALEENPQDFESLFNIRNGLDNNINMLSADKSTIGQITNLKKTMMDYMQNVVGDHAPELREPFKRYAINETRGNVMKKAFGVDIGDSYENTLSKIRQAPENVTNKIFRNSESVNALKQMLPRDQFNHVTANWLSEEMANVRKGTSGVGEFSGAKWNTFLKKNQDVLDAAFSDNPEALQRIKDASTIMRVLPDAPPINPSGTAKTLSLLNEAKEHFKEVHGIADAGIKLASFIKNKTYGEIEKAVALQNLNNKLAGKEASYTVGEHMGEAIKKISDRVNSGAKSIFGGQGENALKATIPSIVDHYEKHSDQIRDLANNPQKLMDMLSQNQTLHNSLPQIAQSMSGHMAQTVAFLNSKLPKPNNELPLSQPWEPNASQKAKFNRYYETVSNPVGVLKQIKSGSLTGESMEALHAVHPDLLQEMQAKVMENLNPKKAKTLNYSTKIALSKFLDHPMDTSMMPTVGMANQAAFSNTQQAQAQQKSTQGGLAKLDLSKRYATATQKLETDKA